MTPDRFPVLAPSAIVCTMLPPERRRRVWVRDPAGESLLRGEGVLVEERRFGTALIGARIRLGGGVDAVVPPSWIADLPPERIDNVLPFPVRR